MKLSALEYAKIACDTRLHNYSSDISLRDEGALDYCNYHDGVFLSGVERVYELTGDEKYYDAVKNWIDRFVDAEGNLLKARLNQLDDLMPVRLMIKLYDRTGDERYKKVLDSVMELYENWQVNEYGGFWHKNIFPNQMWLDSLYMASPNLALYAKRFGEKKYFDLAYKQMKLMWDNMRDNRTGLLYHCWDASKTAVWADKITGLAPEFWGRALGWYVVSTFDLASYMPDDYDKKQEFIDNGVALIKSILLYRDENSKKWFQIVNRTNDPDNWLETSCSCLFTYAIAKAVNEGYLPEEYKEVARECYEGIINDVKIEERKILIDEVCVGTGVLSYDKYLLRARVTNDLHGMGAFVLMCSECAKMDNN